MQIRHCNSAVLCSVITVELMRHFLVSSVIDAKSFKSYWTVTKPRSSAFAHNCFSIALTSNNLEMAGPNFEM